MASDTTDGTGLPWYLKIVIVIVVLVVLFIIAVDLLTFAEAL